jgi:hypothetical protein
LNPGHLKYWDMTPESWNSSLLINIHSSSAASCSFVCTIHQYTHTTWGVLLSSGICHVVRWKPTDIPEEHVTSIFRVKQ